MADRICRGVLWDVHGPLLEHGVHPLSRAPAKRRREWVERIEHVLLAAGATRQQLVEEHLEPLAFWRRRMKTELSLPKERRTPEGMVIIKERRFQLQVNIALLNWVAPTFLRTMSDSDQVRLARALWRKRRNDQGDYTLHPGKRAVVHWLGKECVVQGFITAQARSRAEQILKRVRVPWTLFSCLCISGEMGLPKSHPLIWDRARQMLGKPPFPPEEVVVIEDNLAMGRNAVRSGMALLLIDPDGEVWKFLQEECSGELGGVPVLRVGEAVPLNGPFVMCPRGPRQLKRCLQGMRPQAQGRVPHATS